MRENQRVVWWIGICALVLAAIAIVPAAPVRAATILVDASGDIHVPGNASNCPAVPAGTCTLRDAVAKSVSGDVINFAAGITLIHLVHNASDIFYGGAISIGHDLTISATGANVAIEADPDTQIFSVSDATVLSTGTPIAAQVTLNNLTIQNFSLTTFGVNGGAMSSGSTGLLTLTNMIFKNNSNVNGTFGGGAIFLNSHLRPPLMTDPLLSAPLVVTNCTFDSNQGADDGGGAIEWNGPITVTNSTFTNNISNGGDGGAILDSIVGSDRATPPNGVVTVSDSTFTGNQSIIGVGGAISSNGIVATNVTFTGNQAGSGSGGGGGAVEVHGNNPSTGSPPQSTLTNVTFNGNIAGSANFSGQGGAVYVSNGSLTLLNATITNNSAGVSGGGVSLGSGSLKLGNTIVAGNTGAIFGPDVDTPITSLGHNLIGATDGSSGWIGSDLTGTIASPLNPLLGTLGAYGSADGTQTLPLLPGSPAIDAGTATGAPATDQRGKSRTGTVDIGAFETQGFTLMKTSGDGQTMPPNTAFAPLVVTVTPVAAGEPVNGGIVTFTGPAAGNPGIVTSPVTVTIASAQASITPTANAMLGGPYLVTVATAGVATPVSFSLTNALTPQSYVVTTTGDVPDNTNTACLAVGSGGCTLRQAVNASNAHDPGAGNHNTITFATTGTTTLTNDGTHRTLTLTRDVAIAGATSGAGVTVSGGDAVLVFQVNSGVTVSMSNLTVAHGSGTGVTGGLYNPGGTVTLTNTTFANNASTGNGGAIFNGGTLTLTNSTFVGNTATGGGGAIRSGGSATLTIVNSTFTGNASTGSTGGGIHSSGTLNLTNTIVAGNSAFANPDVDGTIGTNSHNVIGGTPLLGVLGNYGGTTQTVPLLPGSPAIDGGDAAVCASTTLPVGAAVAGKDQRGVTRPAACDIGAFESQGFTLTKTSGDGQSAPINTAFFAPLVVTVASTHSEPVDGGTVTFTGPASGAGIVTSPVTVTIAGGHASITPTANGTSGGPYSVTASATGATPPSVSFSLANVGPVTHLALTGAPASFAGEYYTVTVTAKDASNNTVSGYTGTVRLTTSDPVARLPADHIFIAADNGVATFALVLNSDGNPTITATDRANGAITGTLNVAITGPAIFSTTLIPYGVTPTSGPTAGGTTLTIVGNGFTGTTSITVGGVACASPTPNGAGTQVVCITGAHAVGTVDVVVTTPVHSTTAVGAYTYVDPGNVPPPANRPGPSAPGVPSPAPPSGGGPTTPGSPGVVPVSRP